MIFRTLSRTAMAALLAFVALRANAGEPGESVVVLYNKHLPESKNLAEYYAERRHVPTNQLLGIDIRADEVILRSEFRDRLQLPLFDWLVKEQLFTVNPEKRPAKSTNDYRTIIGAKIRYAVLCYGIPLKIASDPKLKESGEKMKPELRHDEAAVDNELAWLPLARDNVPLLGPIQNTLYAATNAPMMHPTNGILLVARLDGPSVEVAHGLVDKALAAETNGLWGRAYFDARGLKEGNYLLGDEWIRGAAYVCRRLGFETVLDDKEPTFSTNKPLAQIAFYAGWYDTHASGPFSLPAVEFIPGAFAYHLHSYSARTLRSTNLHWVGPLLAKGATISFGSVEEPYLVGTPNVALFLERLIFNGFTFGEAAYVAQTSLSWQTTVVGDPLYRPFGELPEHLHRRLEQQQNPLIEWSHLRVVNLNLATSLPLDEAIKYLESTEVTKRSAILQEKLGDLYREKGKLSLAAAAYTRGVTLNPSHQQKVLLLLAVGETQTLLGREEKAFDAYQQLLREAPEFPNQLFVYQQLVSLAKELKKKDDVAKFEAEVRRLTPPSGSSK